MSKNSAMQSGQEWPGAGSNATRGPDDRSWDPWPTVSLSPVGGEAPFEHYWRTTDPSVAIGPNSPWSLSKRMALEPDLPRLARSAERECRFCQRPTTDAEQASIRQAIARQPEDFTMIRPMHEGFVDVASTEVLSGIYQVCTECFAERSSWVSNDRQTIEKDARRKYNELEKKDLIDEEGEATNSHRLDVVGTHYETEDPLDILRSMPFSL